jgi:hypothetical protein
MRPAFALIFRPVLPWAAVLCALAGPIGRAAEPSEAERANLRFFENEVRPLLVARCHECHGEKKQKAGLRLDARADILKGGETGPALVPGKPDDSLLIQAVRQTDENLQMPPKERLSDAEVAVLEKWVGLGAPWPVEKVQARAERDRHGFSADDRAYWAFQPVRRPAPPAAAGNPWIRNDVDRFIAARQAEHGLTPAPEADRTEFVRRIYLDVHGLPPTRAQIDAFVQDRRPDAYERLVDALLASPRYGERWAQHWLDLVRYADSDGYRADAYRPDAWPYRDYVIRSLNADKPYDQFVREQLAGDELAAGDPGVLVATSYLRNPIYEWNQRDVRGQANLIVDDITANVGEVFLGLSLGCARCHDHKFDPILQRDYFALRSFFEGVLWRSDLTLATAEEKAAWAAADARWQAATADVRARMDGMTSAALDRNVRRAHDRFTEDLQAMMDKPAAEREPLEQILATLAERQLQYERDNFDPLKALKTLEDKARYKALQAELKAFEHLKPKPLPAAFVATDAGRAAPPTRFRTRQGEREVAPGFLTLLDPATPEIAPLPGSTGRRSALAQWLTRPDHPLTSRVIVNRVWQHHFGRGLAGTPNDFGRLGLKPTHPELLDWLAMRLVEGGWRLKPLHREILLSATYRQTARIAPSATAARVDPANSLLWRSPPRRLDAEQARDALLLAAGELDLTEGGAPQEGSVSSRRSIYTIKRRNTPNELLQSLDAPAGFSGIAERQNTATPLQALLFLNGDWVVARSRQLAARSNSEVAAWDAALGRLPSEEEAALARDFLARRSAAAPAAATAASVAATGAGRFRENSPRERLLARAADREGDDFTIEAVVRVESVDAGAAVRTIVSRWNGEKNSPDAHGWSLGVTGQKSAYKPLNLILQLVGEDDNMNTAYEVVPSDLRLELRKSYQIVAKVSCSDRNVTFEVKDLTQPSAPPRSATVRHGVLGKLGAGQSGIVIGGLARRGPHLFDGEIEAVRVTAGVLPHETLALEPARRTGGTMAWDARRALDLTQFEVLGGVANAESADPRQRAMADLCHVLLNSNEFLFLH